MKPIQIFYCVYLPAGRNNLLLNTIRLIANPVAKHPAHITVRGPYSNFQDSQPWSAAVEGGRVDIGGVGAFLGPKQNTVLFEVESASIQSVWYKPSYPEYRPHLTIYDGDSRSFAQGLRDLLESHDPVLSFQMSGLKPLISGNGVLPLRSVYNSESVAAFFDRPISLAEIDAADETTRLAWIAMLAEQLSPHVRRQSLQSSCHDE